MITFIVALRHRIENVCEYKILTYVSICLLPSLWDQHEAGISSLAAEE